jgi:hypothetical protein
MDEAALRLQRAPLNPAFTAEAVEAMKQLALCAAWHAANQRRFCYSDAEKDRRGRMGMVGMVGIWMGTEMRIHMANWRRFCRILHLMEDELDTLWQSKQLEIHEQTEGL